MRDMDDMALLREYTARRSETAFTTLVERHIGLVYCAALRQVRDPAQAQEITQVVFLLLARKAHSLREGTILSTWLYRAARFAASDARKMAFRRQQREQQAVQMQTISPASSDQSTWQQIAPLLDEAMAALGERDRNAVMLRYFEQKSLEEVGVAMGIETGTAQKRVWRAVDKLRQHFSRHSAAFSADAITAALAVHAIDGAPSGLAAAVASAAALKGTTATASTATLLKGTLKLMAWTKLKITAATVVGVLLAAGTATITLKEIQAQRAYPWQDAVMSAEALEKLPPTVMIVPTKFPDKHSGRSISLADGKMWGVGIGPQEIIDHAYGTVETRTVFLSAPPHGRFDFIASLPSGSKGALQKEISRKLRIAGRFETIETNVLFLQVKETNATGLKPTRSTSVALGAGQCYEAGTNQSISRLAASLEGITEIPAFDKTGLAGGYDFDLNWGQYMSQKAIDDDDPSEELPALKKAVTDQLGLELVPAKAPIEMLVIERAK
jgi:uncharacterized protein (TIGR03435 family)